MNNDVQFTMATRMQRDDLRALVEICLMEQKSFGQISREIREEFGLNVRRSVEWTIEGLRIVCEAANDARAYNVAREWFNSVRRPLPEWQFNRV